MISVAVIGGGASGMAFAVALKQKSPDIEVAVFEKNPKMLKKMLVTGMRICAPGGRKICSEENRSDFSRYGFAFDE